MQNNSVERNWNIFEDRQAIGTENVQQRQLQTNALQPKIRFQNADSSSGIAKAMLYIHRYIYYTKYCNNSNKLYIL